MLSHFNQLDAWRDDVKSIQNVFANKINQCSYSLQWPYFPHDDKGTASGKLSEVGFEPTPPMETATWTQRLRPLGHPDWENPKNKPKKSNPELAKTSAKVSFKKLKRSKYLAYWDAERDFKVLARLMWSQSVLFRCWPWLGKGKSAIKVVHL